MIEIFKDIAGYEGLYRVSNFGNVRSMKYEKTRILKPQKAGGGYLIVGLWKEGKEKKHLVHRLVATAFIENTENLPEINHKDEDKTNNVVTNLEYCEHAYNMAYGTRTERCSKKVLQLTLDGKIVREWESTMECGRNGFCQAAVAKCCNGKRKTHKGFRWMFAEDYYKNIA